MEDPSPSDPTSVLEPSELRRRVESTCSEARVERERSVAADAALREARQAAMAARVELDAAVASLDQRRLMDHKDQARRNYRVALSLARDAAARQRAATDWLRRIDELNRASRGALGQVLLLRARCETLDQTVRDASMVSNVQRVRTEAADARCIEARQHLAELDRWAADPAATVVLPVAWASGSVTGAAYPDAPTGATDPSDADVLAVELLLAGDVNAIRAAGAPDGRPDGSAAITLPAAAPGARRDHHRLGHRARAPAVRPQPPHVGTAERRRGERADADAARPWLPVRPG